MSTRCAIIVKVTNDVYKGIYCHWDGYEDGVGKTLKTNFNTKRDALEIVELGACSAIADCVRIKPLGKHTYQNPEAGTIIAYARDRGEEYCVVSGKTWKDVASELNQEIIYTWEDDKNGWVTVNL